jgi:hypothetical protein
MFLHPEGGVGQTQAWMPTYVSILRIPQMIWVWRTTVEWYRQGKAEELGEKSVPVPLCPPQIPQGLTRARTRASFFINHIYMYNIKPLIMFIRRVSTIITDDGQTRPKRVWWNIIKGFMLYIELIKNIMT